MKYDADDLRLLSRLLDEGSDLAGPEREAWLAGLTGDAARLGPALREMLAREASGEMAGAFERLPAFTTPGGDARASDFSPGDPVGPYRLLRLIAIGGMGEVWLAERSDGQLKRSVALKLPMLSVRRSVLAQRFERERDILGALAHPNIARLYDAGIAEDGQPFMALEYVEGTPITQAADEKALDATGRVRWLRQVMDAVQYAHANLVIHRDLKPGNVLVTAQGNAKLLDFGIAKLVEDEATAALETELTRLGGRALTLQYAAPEQVRGAAITTAVDVWALGVLLHELLTGLRPFGGEGRGAVEQDILTRQPARPSQRKSGAIATLPASLAGELDTIVLKALKKDPAERYATVGAFADDLDRWLNGKPVHAQPDSTWYRMRKFVGRHRLGVAAATLAVAILVGTASTAILLGLQAREESARAVAARDFMIDLFLQADPDLSPGRDVTAKQLLAQGYKTVLETMGEQPLLQTELLVGIGDALDFMEDLASADMAFAQAALVYQRMGRPRDAAGVTLARAAMRYYNLWEVQGAADLTEQAMKMHPAPAGDDEFMAQYAVNRVRDAGMNDRFREERAWYERALPHADRALKDTTTRNVMAIRTLARLDGKYNSRQAGTDRLNALLVRLKGDRRSRPAWIVGTLDDLGTVEYSAGRYRAALERYDTADEYCRKSSDPQGIQCIYAQYQRSQALLRLGYLERALDTVPTLLASARLSENSALLAARFTRHAFAVLVVNRQLGRYPDLPDRVRALADSMNGKTELWQEQLPLLLAQGRWLLAELRLDQAREMSGRAKALLSTSDAPPRASAPADLFEGLTAQAMGRHEAALKAMDRAYAGQAEISGADHPLTQLVSVHRARALWATGRRDDALALIDHAAPILRQAMGTDAPSFLMLNALREELASAEPRTPGAMRKVDSFL